MAVSNALRGHVPRSLAYDDDRLDLVINALFISFGQDDGVAGAAQGGRGLQEQGRAGG